MVIISCFTSILIAIQDPIIQNFSARIGGGYLSEKLGTEIKIGRFFISPSFTVHIKDLSIKDLKGENLIYADVLNVKVNIEKLLKGEIEVKKIVLSNTEAQLIQYEGEEDLNLQFIIDYFNSSQKQPSNKESLPISIKHVMLKDVHFVLWNQNRDHPEFKELKTMDYAHLDISHIFLDAKNVVINDSITAKINYLTALESCGFDLKYLKAMANVSSKGIILDNLQIETNHSKMHFDLKMLYNDYHAFQSFVDSVNFDTYIYPTEILLSDIGFFAPVMYEMPDLLNIEGLFQGPVSDFYAENFRFNFGQKTYFDGNAGIKGLPDFMGSCFVLNINQMRYSYNDLSNFAIPGSTVTIPLPEMLKPLGVGTIKGNFYGFYDNFVADASITSEIGNVKASFNMKQNRKSKQVRNYKADIKAERINAGTLLNASDVIGTIDLNFNVSGELNTKNGIAMDIKGDASNASVLGNYINQIFLNGELNSQGFKGNMKINDDKLAMNFNGIVDFPKDKEQVMNFTADITRADLYNLNVVKYDPKSILSTHINANIIGLDPDKMEGSLAIDNTKYIDSRGSYNMGQLNASIVNDNLIQRKINVTSDFFDFEMAGKMNFASIFKSFKEYVTTFARLPKWERDIAENSNLTDQDFFVSLLLKDTETLSRLLMPNLSVANNTSLNGTYTSRPESKVLNATFRSKKIMFNDIKFEEVELKNYNGRQRAVAQLNIDNIIFRNSTEDDPTALGIDNFKITATLRNDSILTDIEWNDLKRIAHNKGLIKTSFLSGSESGGRFNINTADLLINDSIWNVSPDNYIELKDNAVFISNFEFFCHNQRLMLNGNVPLNSSDTLSVDFNQFNISTLDPLTVGKGIDLDGFINGNAQFADLKANPTVFANLEISNLGLNGDDYGNAHIQSNWNNANSFIYINANIINGNQKNLSLNGTYFPQQKEDNISFNLQLDKLRLNVIAPFTKNIISQVKGFGSGDFDISGSLNKPVIEGTLSIKDAGCKIDYLNTYYTFSHNIVLHKNLISLGNMALTDTLGHKAMASGKITHKYLKDFYFDVQIMPRDFLALATTAKENQTFYGTAIVNGMVDIKGYLNDMNLNIRAVTQDGTQMTIPFDYVSSVKTTDFIIFDNPKKQDVGEEIVQEGESKTNDFSINLDLNVTNNAGVQIILPGDIGTIVATGDGNIKIGSSSSGDFTLIGDYLIQNGKFTFKSYIRKVFELEPGGTISWAGNPTDGTINANGVYRTKASINSLGIETDSTTLNSNNINVECIIHLNQSLLNPDISFGLRLPNASNDIKQTVFSVIDTTNQAVMMQQVLSLLILGSFSNVGNRSSDILFSNSFDVITNQISSWLSQISRDFDINLHYKPGSGVSNEELQVALKTQLFNNYLTIETNFGMINNTTSNNATNLVGDFDLYLRLSKDGRLTAHAYNHSNYNTYYYNYTFDKLSPYTQGLGISYSHDFDRIKDIFTRKRKTISPKKPLINKK